MKISLVACIGLIVAAATPAAATEVTLKFSGAIPSSNYSQASGFDYLFTTAQQQYVAINSGTTYDFTFKYDSAATPAAGLYPLQLVSGRVGGMTDFSQFAPYIQFQQAGAYTYMNLMLKRVETFGPNTYTSYAAFALGDNDGTVVANTLPVTIVAADYDFVSVSFEAYGREGAYRSIIDSQSRGLVQQVAGVPEPAAWTMMILGFGMIGAMRRRRPVPRVAFA